MARLMHRHEKKRTKHRKDWAHYCKAESTFYKETHKYYAQASIDLFSLLNIFPKKGPREFDPLSLRKSCVHMHVNKKKFGKKQFSRVLSHDLH